MRPRAAVFCFHDIVRAEALADVPPTHRPYALLPEEFRELVVVAQESGRRAITAGDVPAELGGGFYALTFDDGAVSDYAEAFPVLLELGLRATFFVVPTMVDTRGYCTWSQLREMVAAGMEIGSHSLTHPFLHQLDRAGIEREYGESKAILEDRLGMAIRTASLPRGWEPPEFESVLGALGYRVFCTSRVAWWHPGDRPLAMPRIAVQHGMATEEFGAIAAAEARSLWRLQAIDKAKNLAKACLGVEGWKRLRAPLLALRYGPEARV
jgi:peptidoglycan/xylan/chitin deacetylase (PgdA/CDA1 family)